ncbi:MAG: RecQ family ATP-dependent DNA helicase [Bacteroidia bacterium]|nr:RecQ family ATP-dependent DNA helicase [Bacteroidia bacterium]
MTNITFIDTEIDPKKYRILDIGALKDDGKTFHANSISQFSEFVKGSTFLCGHNIIHHDLKFIGDAVRNAGIPPANAIDTLYLSPLLFPTNPYHKLLKDDKWFPEESSNPLNDCYKAKDLFYDEVNAFNSLNPDIKSIFFSLLGDKREFAAFFRFVNYSTESNSLPEIIRSVLHGSLCNESPLEKLVKEFPVELAYCIALINSQSRYSITPRWVLITFPNLERVMYQLRGKPCLKGCEYCNKAQNIHSALYHFFGFQRFRTYGGEPLQEKAVRAAGENKSLLAVFPTGGGKSLTFQIPALMAGENVKGLTVIISPLQSLMKDQVDNLEKNNRTEAVTINGLLDPIERAKSIHRVENGSASILYIAPESLRSKTIERLLLGRNIVRFVIDEAHCFSSWGHDFRVDYLYIGDFIKQLQQKKGTGENIPVSCFTATAKQNVIQDIREYFRSKLNLELELFTTTATRSNLHYKVLLCQEEEEKYNRIRNLVEEKNCPTIVYVSRTKRAEVLSKRLNEDGFSARTFHGKMEVRDKTANQNAFISGDVPIMVATSAFGMGVDKKNVGLVIHYDISDSLENYIQEAGRAGRDETIEADCYVLYNEEDLSKHFILLNQTKLSIKEIQQVWKAIKDLTRFRSTMSNSALEIARKAGWDHQIDEIETRVTTAISALEESGYLKRGQNMPRVFANSIVSKNADEAIAKINGSSRFDEKQKISAARIIRKLFSTKSRRHVNDEVAESRIDYISDHLGIVKEDVIRVINLMREENILADAQDLTAYIKRGENSTKSLNLVDWISRMEIEILKMFEEDETVVNLKEINEKLETLGCRGVNPERIRTIFNFWTIKNWIKKHLHEGSKNHMTVRFLLNRKELIQKIEKRQQIARHIVFQLFKKSNEDKKSDGKDEALVEFSVLELKNAYEKENVLFKSAASIDDIEDALFYLSRIESIKIEGGFLVTYNRLTIDRLETNNRIQYKSENYEKLNQFYEQKVQQIHIVGEYAKKMVSDYKDALQFVNDYFQLNYSSFLNKYFPGSKQDTIKRNITPAKFKQLFGDLSPRQHKIIADKSSPYIVVAAGPGSGKTKTLVHKLASLLLMEDVKHEQLLMVTFSRAAASEFKKRLFELIGNAAAFIEIKTFHSYCFDLLGKVGSLEKSDEIIRATVEKIKSGDVEINRITKTVLVIDEAQDMDQHEFDLVRALMESNEDMRVIAVGDDDQNIYAFRGADSKYMQQFITNWKAEKYELVENYRSVPEVVGLSNEFVKRLSRRMKETPISAIRSEEGTIRLTRYTSTNLVEPVVADILRTSLKGTTCVLTKTNEEASQVTGLLLRKGIAAKLIQSNDGFNLWNLMEVRWFIGQLTEDAHIISDETWNSSIRNLKKQFIKSTKLELCLAMLTEFELSNKKKKYRSDLEVFIKESKMEDFFKENGEIIFVSTIHKTKGKEFDNVFLMLDNFTCKGDEENRQLYVGVTRAKNNLTIHTNGNFFDDIRVNGFQRTDNTNKFAEPEFLTFHLNMKEVALDSFIPHQTTIGNLVSGQKLIPYTSGCSTASGVQIFRYSRAFNEKVARLTAKGYVPFEASLNSILYWAKDEGNGNFREYMVVLPEVSFRRI